MISSYFDLKRLRRLNAINGIRRKQEIDNNGGYQLYY